VWNDPWALTLSARLILMATLLFALYTATRHFAEAYLPIREVLVTGAARAETRAAIAGIIPSLRGSLFTIDLDAARQRIEELAWVRRVQISRVWPTRLRVDLTEYVPAAAWNDTAILDIHGEVFPVRPWAALPAIHAPDGMASEVARRYGEYAAILAPSGLRIHGIRVDARHAWRLDVRSGPDRQPIFVDLGRERIVERLRRLVTFYPLVAAHSGPARRIDLRYPNGFAVDVANSAESKT
jgi:cell division protein FtsQ